MQTILRGPLRAHETAARWRDAFGKDEVIQRVRPRESKKYLPNPHRGTTTFQRFNGDALYPGMEWDDSKGPEQFSALQLGQPLANAQYPHTTLAYCRWLWSVLEPAKGKIRWEIVDGALAAARARGQTVQMRIQPYIGDDLPPWFWQLGGKAARDGDPSRREPDHNHSAYSTHFGDILRAFAKRYDGHPDLESFDIAYGGPCGETGGNTTVATAKKLVDIYLKSFRKTQLVSMLGTPGCAHASKLARVGWRADCFGDLRSEGKGVVPDGLCWNHMYDSYPREVFENGVSERWKTAPVTLETCWTVPYWEMKGWDVDWILEQGLKYHASIFMPKSCYIPDRWRDKIDAFDRRLGYRFVLRQLNLPLEAKPGARIPFWMWIENVGVAPLYRDYPLALRFRQGETSHIVNLNSDVRTWLPGDVIHAGKITVPRKLQRGEAEVEIAILDEAGSAPRILFANEGAAATGWLPLTKMDVIA
ncbi:MAG TPA: DUF4832 domain-containing protein [Planctomycetota bacterium]|nr:DUF4832 domain-containing protein [Planctomycetota bacterium]